MKITILPSKAYGKTTAPPSKSMAHRLLVCAGCAEGTSRIQNIDLSEDILATLRCLKAMGAEWSLESGTAAGMEGGLEAGTETGTASGAETGTVIMKGIDPGKFREDAFLDCGECGSTLRFMIPLCLMGGQTDTLTGSRTLLGRPLTVYEKICEEQGFVFQKSEGRIQVSGHLAAGEYEIPGNISSQFISGLLFALPLLHGDSRIRLLPPVESRPYILMTMQAQEMFGVTSKWEDDCTIWIRGGQNYRARNVRTEGDYSNAAFLEALNLTGGNVTVEGLCEESLQGDKVYRQYFDRIREGYAGIDLSDCPDLGPVLMAAAALRHGALFSGTRRLRIKESDRGAAMRQELAKIGVPVEISENEIRVASGVRPPQELLDGHNDHRIVMALAVLLTETGGTICGAQAVGKSFPDFWKKLAELGVELKLEKE